MRLHLVFDFFQELEQIEEHYKQETRDLLSTVKRLQDENRKLASSLAAANERDSAFSEDGKFSSFFFVASYSLAFSFFSTICFIHHYSAPATTSSESYFEVELVNRLQSVVEKQRGQIKKLEQSNIEFKSDNEEVRIIYT